MSLKTKKQLVYFNEFKEIVSIFGETEIGTGEVNIEALAEYLESDKFFVDMFDYKIEDIDAIDTYITNLIENGFPVWRYLKISAWTKEMVEKSFTEECKKELKEMKEKYCCLSCKYFYENNTELGLIVKCTKPKGLKYFERIDRDPLEFKESCEYYEYKGE